MRVGFIGLGVMGLPMVQHLIEAGHEVHIWVRRPEVLSTLGNAVFYRAADPAALAEHTEVTFSIVTTDTDVLGLVEGGRGLLAGARPGFIHVDMSTVSPSTARSVADQYQALGAQFLDAPVSGGGQGAREASLAIMVGGDESALERVRPLLECMGSRIVHVGGSGAGQVAKACNQMVMVAGIQALAEAFCLTDSAGVDTGKVKQALAGGSAASKVLDIMGERMVSRDFSAGVEARLHHKDFGILLRAACTQGVPLPLMAQVGQQLNGLMASGLGRSDTAALIRILEVARSAEGFPEA